LAVELTAEAGRPGFSPPSKPVFFKQLGGNPTTAQRFLVRRAARAALRLELLDEELNETGELTAHGARIYSALGNSLRLLLREIGLEAAVVADKATPSLASIAERHKAGRAPAIEAAS
jgi:hypothetical protein